MKTYKRKRSEFRIIENISELCRLCLELNNESVPIFSEEDDMYYDTLGLRIMACTGIQVTKDQNLPQSICQPCHREIEQIYNFRKKCEVAHRRLQLHSLALLGKEEAEDTPKRKTLDKNHATNSNVIKKRNLRKSREESLSAAILSKLTEAGVLSVAAQLSPEVAQLHPGLVLEDVMLELSTGDSEVLTLELIEESEKETSSAPQQLVIDNKLISSDEQNVDNTKKTCEVCRKTFTTNSVLDRHMRVHTGERPYACSQCPRTFSQRAVLRRHTLVHLEKKPFCCDSCPKSFTQSSALAAHSRTHLPRRPLTLFSCRLCPRVFLYASGLRRHLVVGHLGRSYQCFACPRHFTDISSYSRHVRRAHADLPTPDSHTKVWKNNNKTATESVDNLGCLGLSDDVT